MPPAVLRAASAAACRAGGACRPPIILLLACFAAVAGELDLGDVADQLEPRALIAFLVRFDMQFG
jgi:hypothetical protein